MENYGPAVNRPPLIVKMSTIVVVQKKGFAAIAADSLTTWSSAKEISDYVINHEKIISVGESYLAVSGPTSAKMAIKDYFASRPDADLTRSHLINTVRGG